MSRAESEEFVSRESIAKTLGVTARQVTNLRSQHSDFPARVRSRSVDFPRDRCVHWFIAYKEREVRQRLKGDSPTNAFASKQAEGDSRKAMAAAAIEEMKQAVMSKGLVRADEMRAEVGNILGAMAAAVDTFPSQYAHHVLNLTTKPAAIAALRKIADLFRAELRRLKLPEIPKDEEAVAA